MGLPKAFAETPGAARRAAEQSGRVSGKLWADVLRAVPLFEGVSDRHLRKIAALGTVTAYEPGTTVVRKGDAGDACFVVLEGRALVVTGRGRPGVPLQPGAIFGELALLDGTPRSATVVADTELRLFRLGRTQFTKTLRAEPAIALALLRSLAARVRALSGA